MKCYFCWNKHVLDVNKFGISCYFLFKVVFANCDSSEKLIKKNYLLLKDNFSMNIFLYCFFKSKSYELSQHFQCSESPKVTPKKNAPPQLEVMLSTQEVWHSGQSSKVTRKGQEWSRFPDVFSHSLVIALTLLDLDSRKFRNILGCNNVVIQLCIKFCTILWNSM